MEAIWKIAIGLAGIGAIGAFVFWSLYKHWLQLQIFAPLTKEQTFTLMKMFLWLTFGFAIVAVAAYFFNNPFPPPIAESRLKIVRVTAEAPAPTIGDDESPREYRAVLDITLSNTGGKVAVLHGVIVDVQDRWELLPVQRTSGLPLTPTRLEVSLPASKRWPYSKNIRIENEVPSNKGEAIHLIFTNHYDSLDEADQELEEGVGRDYVYTIQVRLIYDEDNKEVSTEPFLILVRDAKDVFTVADLLSKDQDEFTKLAAGNEKRLQVNREVAKKIAQSKAKRSSELSDLAQRILTVPEKK